MKNKRTRLYLVLAAIAVISVGFALTLPMLLPGFRLYDETLHSAIEAMGAQAAFVMAVFLLLREEDGCGCKHPLLAAGFLGMGTLDAVHAFSPPGDGFVLLHGLAGLVGGLLFALIWVPCKGSWFVKKLLPWVVTTGAVAFGIYAALYQDALPVMVTNGEFTTLAKGINVLAGALFIVAAARQLTDFHRSGEIESYLFSCLLLLFGLAAAMFSYSALWDETWWFWHLERLASYALVLWWVVTRHGRLVDELRAALSERKLADEERLLLYHMLTHDIKSPLTLIYGYSEILCGQVDASSAEMVAEIKKAAGRISSLIEDMLAMSKAESKAGALKLEPVHLPEVLAQAVNENELPASEIDVSIILNIEGPLPVLLGDRLQLIRAFLNLVGNAVKYNRQGGGVYVHAWTDAKAPGQVMVEVSDTGLGIAVEDLPHVFDKYYRGRKTGDARGTGLGLAVVKAVVESHGGTVSVRSNEKAGSTFRVTLPVKQG